MTRPLRTQRFGCQKKTKDEKLNNQINMTQSKILFQQNGIFYALHFGQHAVIAEEIHHWWLETFDTVLNSARMEINHD